MKKIVKILLILLGTLLGILFLSGIILITRKKTSVANAELMVQLEKLDVEAEVAKDPENWTEEELKEYLEESEIPIDGLNTKENLLEKVKKSVQEGRTEPAVGSQGAAEDERRELVKIVKFLKEEGVPSHLDLYPHLYNQAPIQISSRKIPRVCWAFWFGKELPPKRKEHLDKMRKVLGVSVILVTPDNIGKYLVAPIHAAVPYLSGIHKSDYFRIYFMLNYGGGYQDIKNPLKSWVPHFDLFDKDPLVQVIGSPEQLPEDVATAPGNEHYKSLYPFLISNGHFIARPNSNYMKELHSEQHMVLDNHYGKLSTRPSLGYFPPERRHDPSWDPYPLRWAELMGEIHSYVCIHHHRNVKSVMTPIDVTTDYGEKASAPQKDKPTGERPPQRKWTDEDFLKPYTLPPPPPKS